VLGITNIAQNLCKISFRHKKHDELTMRNHHQCHVGTTPLPEVNYNSEGKEKVGGQKIIQRILVNPRKAKETSTRKTNPKTKIQGKVRNLSNATDVVVLIILQRNVTYPCNTLRYRSLIRSLKLQLSLKARANQVIEV
jgi:hypothetical protein